MDSKKYGKDLIFYIISLNLLIVFAIYG